VEHAIFTRPGVGSTARIVQSQALRFSRVTMDEPALLVVRFGRKELRAPGFACVLEPGDAVVLAQGQVVDIVNTPGPDGRYQADWLVWDPAVLEGHVPRHPASRAVEEIRGLHGLSKGLSDAIDAAIDVLRRPDEVPDAVARHRLAEVLVWLDLLGIRIERRAPSGTGALVRRLVHASPEARWPAEAVATRLAMSEATLRRRLAQEGTTLGALIADVRMSLAMQLLQSTDVPITGIALRIGYESASRFAIRFRRRFGFAPSAIRDHHRRP